MTFFLAQDGNKFGVINSKGEIVVDFKYDHLQKIEDIQVIEGIKKYNVYIDVNKIPYQYIKGGSSWFCEEKWNDEIKIEQHPKKETSEERVARITRELEEMHKKEEEMKNERE